jgi:hypothetical protein
LSVGGESWSGEENLVWGRRTLSGGKEPCLGRRALSG